MSLNVNNTGLLYYFPFDTDVLEYSSGSGVANGTANSVGISQGTTIFTNGSLYITGASGGYFQLPNTTFGTTGLTMSFWMNCKSINTGQSIFTFGNSASTTNFRLSSSSGNAFWITNNGVELGFAFDAPSGWNHYCITITSGGSGILYLNNVNRATFSWAYPKTLLDRCIIGQLSAVQPVEWFNKFTVFNRVLTSTEILYVYKYPVQVVFSSEATTSTFTTDSYVLTPSEIAYPISSPKISVNYSSLNYALGTRYSLKNGTGTKFTSNLFLSGSPSINVRSMTVPSGGLIRISVDSNGNIYYIRQSAIWVYNSNWQFVATITTSEGYNCLCIDVSNNKLYCGGSSTIGILNLTTLALTTLTAPTNGLCSLALGPDGYLYGNAAISVNVIRRINPANGTYTTIFNNATIGYFGACDFDSSGYLYCITNGNPTGNIYKFDTSGNNYGLFANSTITFASTLSYNKQKNVLYAAGIGSGKIMQISVSTGVVSTFLNTSTMTGLFYDPYTNYLYSVDGDSGSYAAYIYPTSASNYSMDFVFPSSNLGYGANVLQLYNQSNVAFGISLTIDITCFLEGTLIACLAPNLIDDVYIPVEKLTKQTYIKTLSSGYIKIHSIGYTEIYNPSEETDSKNRLFKYKTGDERMPELFRDLYITGNHAALVETFSQEEYDRVVKHMGAVYETEKRFRMPACLDSRAEPFMEPGPCKIWHFALQNPDIYNNYGVYANGLLVESSSIRYLTELSKMELVE